MTAEGAPMWKDPSMVALAKDVVKYLLVAGVLLYLVMGVIRPAFSELAAAGEASRLRQERREMEERETTMAPDVVHLGGRRAHSYEEDMQMVKDMAKDDPKIVANVVKGWVSKG
jgi:flagellar M-ring protein FliF